MLKSALFLVAFLFPLVSVAGPGSFIFKVNGTKETYSPECIRSISYVDSDETGSENVNFYLSDECGRMLNVTTKQNIGKKLSIYDKGNLLSSANIVSVLRNTFRISGKEMARLVLMQLLNDYGVTHN
ncbi:Insecticidal toxin complex protein tccz [Enterobacteriaceae bacterium EKM102V]|uniref:SecDF P1 head subdomain-containing protein n=1 Tax=Pantoea TaxID=53335 RepID=UPI00142E89AB|nr:MULTISPECIES: Insecticidal toxin complex protein tccz [Pantoea]KAF6660226.1 Insecticidal toxin complex protein tccz [Enterobacteriaceae bacterium EKM102V]KAF6669935.1 Insecticidal toxin complex protein tccz [Pantoea sp. EKM103V]